MTNSIVEPLSIDIPNRPRTTGILGDLRDFQQDPLAFWLEVGNLAPLVRIRFGPITRFVVNCPEIARHILQINHKNYGKDRKLVKLLEQGTGPVLATTEGEDWSWRRKLMQAKFKRGEIKHFDTDIVNATKAMLSDLRLDQIIDIAAIMKVLTMNIIGKTMFSVDFESEVTQLPKAYSDFAENIVARVSRLINLPYFIPTKTNRDLKQSIGKMTGALQSILDARRADPKPRNDLLDMLLTHRLEDSEHRLTESQLIHEMSALVFAGHETTATTLTWFFYVMAKHPEVAARVKQEINAVLQGQTPTADDVKAMPYISRVIDETLRLYPPLYINSRQALNADQLGDYSIAGGSRLLINILGIHRNADYWPEPDSFNPDRFLPESTKKRHRFAMIPFLNGPRKCLGAALAKLELQLVIPVILQQFDLALLPDEQVEPEVGVVLQPRGGLRMTVS